MCGAAASAVANPFGLSDKIFLCGYVVLLHLNSPPFLTLTLSFTFNHLPPHTACLRCIGDHSALVRSTIGILVTTITNIVSCFHILTSFDSQPSFYQPNSPHPFFRLSQGYLSHWPELLPSLLQLIHSQDPFVVEGAFKSLANICEDSLQELAEPHNSHLMDLMVQNISVFLQHSSAKIRWGENVCV